MKVFLKNPIIVWFIWYLKSRKILLHNKNKHLQIGYLTDLVNVHIGNYNTFYSNISIINSKINDFVYVGNETKIITASIGKFCSIGPNVKIGLGMHPTNFISTFPAFYATRKICKITFSDKDYFEETGSIIIGNDVWIGSNAIILDNLIIGDGAIIAAGAVVTKNVEPYSIVGGVPARLIRKRFSNEEIEKLLNIKWWNKDLNWINKMHSSFNDPKIFFEDIYNEK